jgi:Dolichyl-phosphate-mannose-protein mannosyltransferase
MSTAVIAARDPEREDSTTSRRWSALLALPRRHRRWVVAAAVVILLGQMLVAMVTAARQQSPVVDEPVYVAAATSYLQEHSLRLNPEHPPLAKLIAGIGLAFGDVRLDPTYTGSQWQVGHEVLYGWGNDGDSVLWHARLPLVVLTLLFGLVVFAFARDLFGAAAGLLALGLYAFSPDVIAHGSLATNDVPVAGFLLTTSWLLWRGHAKPLRYLPLAGLAFGCALATKMSALPVFPAVFFLAALAIWRTNPRRRLLTSLAVAGGVCLIAIATVWATYLLVDPRLGFQAPDGAANPSGLTRLAVDLLPFPRAYRGGLLVQLGFEDQTFGSYLFGHRFTGSRWYYIPGALLVKTPLGMIALWLAGTATLLWHRRLRHIALYLLLPLGLLLPITMAGSRAFGVRYVLWVPLFLAVAATAVLTNRRRWTLPASVALVAFVAVSSLRAFPYYLPYSNEAFGGPANTWRYLNDSNVDWGQDLRRLGDYLADHPTDEEVWLIYKGRGDARYYGIDAKDGTKVPRDQVHGLLAISVQRITGASDGYRDLIGGRTPMTTIGHTIRIYRIP